MTIDQMWERLAQHQPFADQRGYGEAWARMCEEKTPEAAWAAEAAALAADADADAAWAAAAVAAAVRAAKTAVEWIEKAQGRE